MNTEFIPKTFNYENEKFEFEIRYSKEYLIFIEAKDKITFDTYGCAIMDSDKHSLYSTSNILNWDNVSMQMIYNLFANKTENVIVKYPNHAEDILKIDISLNNDIKELCMDLQIQLRKIEAKDNYKMQLKIDHLMKENKNLKENSEVLEEKVEKLEKELEFHSEQLDLLKYIMMVNTSKTEVNFRCNIRYPNLPNFQSLRFGDLNNTSKYYGNLKDYFLQNKKYKLEPKNIN